MSKKYYKSALFTDIHFGAKGNSELHNTDCVNFIKWFIEEIKKDKDIDSIIFLGDWHENRNAVNVSTLKYSYEGAKLLNDLNMPIYFIIGNHDLYHRTNRDIHSIPHFDEFKNFIMINDITIVKELGDDGCLLSPFLFHHEYERLLEYSSYPVWMGHFEFQGFYVTGYTSVMKNGPDAGLFNKPKHILSGHFHKRQNSKNVTYIGNTFPMSYADANDINRGMGIYDFSKHKLYFINWEDCPRYIKCTLSEINDGVVKLQKGSRVNCLLDQDITYEESNILKTELIEKYGLRELSLEEFSGLEEDLVNTETDIDDIEGLMDTNELVSLMLGDIKSKEINNDKLIKLYKSL